MALTSLGNAAHKLSAHIGTWPRAAVFSVGIAVGLSIGGPAAASAAVESWTRGPRRRRGDRRRLEAAPPTDKEPYPYDAIEGGAHLDTPLGRTRYYDCGPRDGVKVVLIHGVSTPSNIWRHAIPILVKQGFRVLAYDLVGRGYSEGVDATGLSEEEIYINQLCYLVTGLVDWTGRFSIVGFSMGGRVTAAFARFFPNRIDKICLVAPAGMMSEDMLPPHLSAINRGKISHNRAKNIIFGPQVVGSMAPNVRSMVMWQLENHDGFADALTSSWLSGILTTSPAAPFKQLAAKFGSRMQAVWGDKDTTCLPEGAKSVPGLKVAFVKGGTHFFLLDDKLRDEVVEHILNVLKA